MAEVFQRRLEDLDGQQTTHVEHKMKGSEFKAHNDSWARTELLLQQHLVQGHGFQGGPSGIDGLTEMHRYDHSEEGFPEGYGAPSPPPPYTGLVADYLAVAKGKLADIIPEDSLRMAFDYYGEATPLGRMVTPLIDALVHLVETP